MTTAWKNPAKQILVHNYNKDFLHPLLAFKDVTTQGNNDSQVTGQVQTVTGNVEANSDDAQQVQQGQPGQSDQPDKNDRKIAHGCV